MVTLIFPSHTKVVSSESVVVVHMLQYHNLYNAEVRGDQFCCCGEEICVNRTNFPSRCLSVCNIMFRIYFSGCSLTEACTLTTGVFSNASSIISWPITELAFVNSSFVNEVIINK